MSSLMNHDDTGSIRDLTPILLNTDPVIDNKMDFDQENQIPLLNQHQLQEKLGLILEQIEKSRQDLAELKDQLVKLKEQHHKFVKFFY
jgi:DNA repair exonuclease SbcCD ATPase subunit